MREILLCVVLICSSCSSQVGQTAKLVARIPWLNRDSTATSCEVRERRSDPDQLPERELTIVDPQGHRVSVLQTPDAFLAMYPVGEEDALLITVWVAGSAYKIRVLDWVGNTAQIVLDSGSKSFPEVIDRDGGGVFILLSDVSGDPAILDNWSAIRYSWDGVRISRLDQVAFSSRLANLPK